MKKWWYSEYPGEDAYAAQTPGYLVDRFNWTGPFAAGYLIPAERWEKLRELVAENNKNIGFMNEEEIKISLVYLLAAIEAIEEEV